MNTPFLTNPCHKEFYFPWNWHMACGHRQCRQKSAHFDGKKFALSCQKRENQQEEVDWMKANVCQCQSFLQKDRLVQIIESFSMSFLDCWKRNKMYCIVVKTIFISIKGKYFFKVVKRFLADRYGRSRRAGHWGHWTLFVLRLRWAEWAEGGRGLDRCCQLLARC